MFTSTEIFDLAMRIEENGEAFFRGAVKKMSEPALKSLFEWLAEQEVKHKEWFSVKKDGAEMRIKPSDFEKAGSGILQDILGDQSFSLKEADFDHISSAREILDLAIEFERDTILFFEMLLSLVLDDATGTELEEIIAEEKRHMELLREKLSLGDEALQMAY